MKIKLTKKGKILLFVIIGIAVLGSGGYLLWRVLQDNTVAPTDSDAGGGNGSCCYKDIGCVSGWVCTSTYCGGTAGNGFYSCSQFDGNEQGCKSSGHCFWSGSSCYTGTCVPEEGPPSEGDCQDVKCEWPTVVMSHLNCACKRCDEVSGVCSGNPDKCTPPACPSGYVSCGVSGSHESDPECTKSNSKYCWGNHPDCNNPFVVYRYCKPETQEPENTCVGGNWLDRPSGNYPYGTELNPITIRTTDPDGLGAVTLKVNGNTKPSCQNLTGSTCYQKDNKDIKIYISPGQQYIAPGTYGITVTWKDGKGLGGSNCTKSTTFTIQEEPQTPQCWESCTTNPDNCPSGLECNGTRCVNPDCPTESDCTCPNQPQCWESCTTNPDNCPTGLECNGTRCVNPNCPTENDCTCPTSECGDGILTDGEQCELGNPNGYQCMWEECDQELCICEEPENPDWTIVKTATPQCIEEGEEVYAKSTYTITITNVGEGDGSIDRVEDALDEKVLETYLNDISNDGAYASGTITWDLEGEEETFSPDESMQFTYYIQVPADAFGTYENRATAYPGEGDNFSDDESVDLICNTPEDIPETGIFDSVIARIAAGLVLILIGLNWSKINYSINEIVSNRRIKHFERKVAKDK
jgi:hypothetical protein